MSQILDMPIGDNGISVSEVYGVFASGPVGHGRATSTVPKVEKNQAVSFRKMVASRGRSFVYLLNAPYQFSDDSKTMAELDRYLYWVLCEVRPDALVISSLPLMQYVRRRDQNIRIYISTIAGVKSPEDLERFSCVSPSRVILHHDLGKERNNLLAMVRIGEESNTEIEIMVTESCKYRCENRGSHYAHLANRSSKRSDRPFMTFCSAEKLVHPYKFLMSGAAIRPEDLKIYEDIGVSHFKISGRDMPASWLPEVVAAYQGRSYKGNFIRLLDLDPHLKADQWIYIDHEALDGFLPDYPWTESYESQKLYCNDWITRLYSEKKFAVEYTTYCTRDGILTLNRAGYRAEAVLDGRRIIFN